MVAVDTHTDDEGLALLDTGDVVAWFERLYPHTVAGLRRLFRREVNLSPYKRYSPDVLRLIEWMFWDWFAFDCAVTAICSDDDGDGPDRAAEVVIEPAKDGMSPYRAVAECLHDGDDALMSDRQLGDALETDESNFAAMFWIHDANAVSGTMTVEDVFNGGVYRVWCPDASARYDGAHGGLIVSRIAKVRGKWRFCAIPVYESRYPGTVEDGRGFIDDMRRGEYRPDFPGLVRFFYGRAKDTGLDMEDMAALRDLWAAM